MNTNRSFFERNGGTYRQVGDYLLPNLTIDESEQKLNQHLAEIERSCEEQLEHIIQQMTKQEGVTEVLKATDQMAWVARMNSIRNRAEEIVLSEIVYR